MQHPDRATLLAYKKRLRLFAACTQSNYLTSVRQLFRYLERTTGYPDPTRDIKSIRHPSGHRKDALSLDQLCELLDSIPTNSLMGLRDAALLNLSTVADFVVVGQHCLAHLQRYLSARPSAKASDNCRGAGLGTTTLRKIAKRYLRKIGINTLHTQ